MRTKAIQSHIMTDRLSFREFGGPFKNLPELEDDPPEVPADGEANQ